MFGRLGPMELAVILGIVVLIFGVNRLPQLGKSLGQTIKEFRGAGRELDRAVHDDPDHEHDE